MSTVIKVENLSKQYRLGTVGASTFKEDTQRWFAKIRGKQDPFLNLGSVNDRTLKDDSKFVWSLKDINFEVQQGDVLGVIGRNGAGKSTLLKILSKVTAPTTGSVKVKGRIASLLEVGTGFHPELTGRENIYLNGAILGMRKHEITRKLDEIIAFAGVEKYVDTPVKRYSSGMYVRLAFAVAAHLESEILIVDEVLAVGDADFQKKCLGKMGDISKGEGRTILFVSHNSESIKLLCNKGLLLSNGRVEMYSNIIDVTDKYYKDFNTYIQKYIFERKISENSKIIQFRKIELINESINSIIYFNDEIAFKVSIEVLNKISNSIITFIIRTKGNDILWSFDTDFNQNILNKRDKGLYTYYIKIPRYLLKVGYYTVSFNSGIIGGEIIDNVDNAISFSIFEADDNSFMKSYSERRGGLIASPLNWNLIES